jgi:hypothetical protein
MAASSSAFIQNNFLLQSPLAEKLYFEYAAHHLLKLLPIKNLIIFRKYGLLVIITSGEQ